MTTYFVDTALGDDANAGTSEGAGNAWATIDKAMNTVAAGDKVWVKASGNYNETATMDTIGTFTNNIVFEGYTTTPGDNGKVTIDGQSTRTSTISSLLAGAYYIFKNFIFTGATSHSVSMTNTDNVLFFNCEFTSNGGRGVVGDNTLTFVCCEFTNNTGEGIYVDSSAVAVGCIFSGNASSQVRMLGCIAFYKNVVYNTASSGLGADLNSANFVGMNTLDGEGGTNIGIKNETAPSSQSILVDNIIYDWGTGVDAPATPTWALSFWGFNLLNSNSIADYDSTGEMYGIQDVTSAPGFNNEAGDDYRLGQNSSALNAGLKPGGIT
jgi:hypothetical protein